MVPGMTADAQTELKKDEVGKWSRHFPGVPHDAMGIVKECLKKIAATKPDNLETCTHPDVPGNAQDTYGDHQHQVRQPNTDDIGRLEGKTPALACSPAHFH